MKWYDFDFVSTTDLSVAVLAAQDLILAHGRQSIIYADTNSALMSFIVALSGLEPPENTFTLGTMSLCDGVFQFDYALSQEEIDARQ